MKMQLTRDKWITQQSKLNYNTDGSIYISVRVKFDGNGNSVTRFIVSVTGKETSYEKYDAAVTAYNIANKK